MRTEFAYTEDTCPGHVASREDARICGLCGVHVDSLRPDDDEEDDYSGADAD